MQSWPDEPFVRSDLCALQLTGVDLRRGQRRGEVRQIVFGVWVAASVPDSLDLRVQAVARAVRPHHVVTDRTASWLHGVDAHVRAEHVAGPPIETCALRGREPTERTGIDGRTRDLAPRDVMQLDGVLVTTPLRTALDLGCNLRRREAYAAMNALARGHELTRDHLIRELQRFRGRRGVIQLRELAALVDPRVESHRESWVLVAIHDAGLVLPEPQYWIVVDGVPTYRLDFAYPWLRVCVEYDGHDAHDGQEAYDEERREWLRRNGWTVIVVREGDFTGAALDLWLRELRAALAPAYSNRRW